MNTYTSRALLMYSLVLLLYSLKIVRIFLILFRLSCRSCSFSVKTRSVFTKQLPDLYKTLYSCKPFNYFACNEYDAL